MTDSLTAKEYTPQELKDAFIKLYGGDPSLVGLYSSPARIILLVNI